MSPIRSLAALAALVTAPVVAPTVAAAQPAAQAPRQCFFAREVNRWSDAGPNAIDVKISSREVYRLTLFAPCPELRSTLSIALDPASGSSVCEGDRTTALIVRSSSGLDTVRCPIESVRRLSPEEIAAPKR